LIRRPIDKLVQLDCRLFDRVASSRVPALDKTLPPLTRAANNSAIWIATAGALTAFGGRRGKRAALRGIGSIGLTSLFVNQVIKRLVRRPRPSLRRVPAARRLRAQPLTTSFPSGHAASAAAFAVGVSSELPAARVPLAALAGAVGYSRTYVGVHYPFDVLTGAAIGASIGMLTRLQWPLLPTEVEETPPARSTVKLEPRPEGEGVVIVVNTDAGNPLTGPSADELRERLPKAKVIELDDPTKLEDVLRSSVNGAAVLGVSGGDGSTATAATIASDLGKPLLLIPAGTLNHLGRDLRVESEDDALAALERGEASAIDLGVIDGKPFINTASFGGYTVMLETRGALQKRIGRWAAHFAAVAIAVFKAEPLEIELDGRRQSVWMVFIGNSRHEPAGFAPSWRPALDDGELDVRILSGEHPFARVRLLLSILTGRLTRSVAYTQKCVGELKVHSDRERMTLARDGDSFEGSGSFEVTKLRRKLVVYAPAG
jgi:undecaprenyl-diphosphatase